MDTHTRRPYYYILYLRMHVACGEEAAALVAWATLAVTSAAVVAAKAAIPIVAAAEVVAARCATGLAAALRLGVSDHPSISNEK